MNQRLTNLELRKQRRNTARYFSDEFLFYRYIITPYRLQTNNVSSIKKSDAKLSLWLRRQRRIQPTYLIDRHRFKPSNLIFAHPVIQRDIGCLLLWKHSIDLREHLLYEEHETLTFTTTSINDVEVGENICTLLLLHTLRYCNMLTKLNFITIEDRLIDNSMIKLIFKIDSLTAQIQVMLRNCSFTNDAIFTIKTASSSYHGVCNDS